MKRILMVATYPIAQPQHGGQKRVKAIHDAYSQFAEVRFCAFYNELNYAHHGRYDIKVPRKYDQLMAQHPLTSDVVTGRLLYSDAGLREHFIGLLQSFNPDVLEFEHPFLYIGAQKILKEIGFNGAIVCSSHNVEAPMKEEMLSSEGYSAQYIQEFCGDIHDAERRLAQDARLLIAVSKGDAEAFAAMGVDPGKIVIAQNGMEPFRPVQAEDAAYWRHYFERKGIRKKALFVGSAHPPNWIGFEQMVGYAVGFLAPNESIVMAGSVGDYFAQHYHKGDMASTLLWKRTVNVGRLSESRLQALLAAADCLVLPITEGGGSNLKTAEALLSQKPIVGTTYAFRAFERFMSFPNMYIADDPAEFRSKIAHALRTTPEPFTTQQISEIQTVTWQSCLKEAAERMKQL